MVDEVYTRLRAHLNTFILGAPEAVAILEILRLRFTPAEAEVALLLGPSHVDAVTLAARSNRREDELLTLLEQMADKALVYKKVVEREGGARDVYSLLPTAVGLWETSFATGERNPRT
ncbi:MAG: hypothetical protein IH614_04400, partial [Desulfuromonadales bacterium]|nr:hypothetical protein [Desulfuromonadales bacterium]